MIWKLVARRTTYLDRDPSQARVPCIFFQCSIIYAIDRKSYSLTKSRLWYYRKRGMCHKSQLCSIYFGWKKRWWRAMNWWMHSFEKWKECRVSVVGGFREAGRHRPGSAKRFSWVFLMLRMINFFCLKDFLNTRECEWVAWQFTPNSWNLDTRKYVRYI